MISFADFGDGCKKPAEHEPGFLKKKVGCSNFCLQTCCPNNPHPEGCQSACGCACPMKHVGDEVSPGPPIPPPPPLHDPCDWPICHRRRRRRRRKLSSLDTMKAKPKAEPVPGFPPEPASCIAELKKVCGQCFKGASPDMGCLEKCGPAHIPELVKAGCKKPAHL